MPPKNGSCFIHDLHWERYQPLPTNIDALVSKMEVEASEKQAADRELKLCIAAAKQFELKQQVEAIQTAIQSKVKRIPLITNNLIASGARVKEIFFTFIENRNLKLAKAAVVPESVPVTTVVADESDFNQDWNCGDWCQGYNRPRIDFLPVREVANLFVYTLEAPTVDAPTTTPIDSIAPESIADMANPESIADMANPESIAQTAIPASISQTAIPASIMETAAPEIVDSCAMAYAEYCGDNLLTQAEINQWNSAIAAEIAHPWQFGVDPICTEVQSTALVAISAMDVEPRSVCCPIDDAVEAVSTVANAESAKVDESSAIVAEVSEAISNIISVEIAVRPPILDAEIEIIDSIPATVFDVRGQVHCLISDFDAGVFAVGNDNDLFGSYGYAHPLLGTINPPRWLNEQGKRFAFGDHSPRMPIALPPVATFSKEDLDFANRFASDLMGSSSSRVDEVQSEGSQLPTRESETFQSKDFLTTLQSSTYGSIVLPVKQTQQMAWEFAMQLISETSTNSNTNASRKVASQLRTVGQFLVDFANQIENRAEQVEIARGENKRLESNQR